MSFTRPTVGGEADVGERRRPRFLALGAVAVLTLTYLGILFHVIQVVSVPGGVWVFVAEAVASLALAVALARTLPVRGAVALGAALMGAGLVLYLVAVPADALDFGSQLRDTVSLLTGLSVLQIRQAGVWALGFAPAPVFVSWYFALRRAYAYSVLVGGAALGFFVLTGDAGTMLALVGVLGTVGALGFGRLDVEGGAKSQRNAVVSLLVAMLVVTTSVSLVPGGDARPLLPDGGTPSVEGSLVSADSAVDIQGSVELTSTVRFTVTANRKAFWRVAAYDRYTGDTWVRTGRTLPYDGPLPPPEADAGRVLRQTFRAESSVRTMPAAWKPVRVDGRADRTGVTDMGGLQPTAALAEGDEYSVVSYQNTPADAALRRAGTDYPPAIRERYLQVPESTPDRVARFTDEITADADTPHETAVAVERWLETNKEYSLSVDRPEGDVVSGFLFDMDRGYCVYYASAMVTMLRTQDVPARFVVGYTPGQQVDENQWVVRGYDSHAWVEVYFPNHGWVQFDPTPAGPRRQAEAARLSEARAAGESNVDTEQSSSDRDGLSSDPDALNLGTQRSPNDASLNPSLPDATGSPNTTGPPSNGSNEAFETPPDGGTTDGGADGPRRPATETVLYGLILASGVVTGLHRIGLLRRSYRAVWLRRSPGGSPEARVEAAFARLEYLLARRHRPRRTNETPREYLVEIRDRMSPRVATTDRYPDDRVERLFDLYERARYGGRLTAEDADRATRLLRELVDDWSAW